MRKWKFTGEESSVVKRKDTERTKKWLTFIVLPEFLDVFLVEIGLIKNTLAFPRV